MIINIYCYAKLLDKYKSTYKQRGRWNRCCKKDAMFQYFEVIGDYHFKYENKLQSNQPNQNEPNTTNAFY